MQSKGRLVLGLALVASLTGCAGVQGLSPNGVGNGSLLGGVKPGANVIASGAGNLANQALEPLNGLQFKPIADGKMLQNGGLQNALSSNQAQGATQSKAAAPAAPTMAAAPASMAGGGAMVAADAAMVAPMPTTISARPESAPSAGGGSAVSGNLYGYYGYGYFFGAENDQMALVSLLQAEAAGVSGGFKEVMAQVAAPAVKEWAADARLIQTQALVDQDGKLFPAPEGADAAVGSPLDGFYGDRSGWRLVFRSNARGEVLIFTVTAAKSLVIRLRWAPLNLDPARVAVDSGAAIRSLVAAVGDRAAKSEEEKTGLDYFLGVKFSVPEWVNQKDSQNRTEVVYAVSPKTRWNVSLDMVMGKLVWNLNGWANEGNDVAVPMPAVDMPMARVGVATPAIAVGEPNPGKPVDCVAMRPVERMGWFNQSIQGMVDAETGAVIRFSRPTKNYYTDFGGCPEPGVVEGSEGKPEPGVAVSSSGSTGSATVASN